MTDQLISYDNALLLKKLGFNEETLYYYNPNKTLEEDRYLTSGSSTDVDAPVYLEEFYDYYNNYASKLASPTQAHAARWLRTKGIDIDLHVCYFVTSDRYSFFIHKDKKEVFNANNEFATLMENEDLPRDHNKIYDECGFLFKTYEEALEEAISRSLKLLKDERT